MIYAVIIDIPEQNELSKKHCFGDCGKIICAGLNLGFGSSFICRIDQCPYEEKRTPEVGDLDGEPVVLRKLNELPEVKG